MPPDPMNPHRGTIHHMNLNLSELKRSLAFYGPVLSCLGYERAVSGEGKMDPGRLSSCTLKQGLCLRSRLNWLE